MPDSADNQSQRQENPPAQQISEPSRLLTLINLVFQFNTSTFKSIRKALLWLLPLLILDLFASITYYIWFTITDHNPPHFDPNSVDLSGFLKDSGITESQLKKLKTYAEYQANRNTYNQFKASSEMIQTYETIEKLKADFIKEAKDQHDKKYEESFTRFIAMYETDIFKLANLFDLSSSGIYNGLGIRWKICEITSLVVTIFIIATIIYHETLPFYFRGSVRHLWCTAKTERSKITAYSRGFLYIIFSSIVLYCKTDGQLYFKSLPYVRWIRLILYIRIWCLGMKYMGIYLRKFYSGTLECRLGENYQEPQNMLAYSGDIEMQAAADQLINRNENQQQQQQQNENDSQLYDTPNLNDSSSPKIPSRPIIGTPNEDIHNTSASRPIFTGPGSKRSDDFETVVFPKKPAKPSRKSREDKIKELIKDKRKNSGPPAYKKNDELSSDSTI